MIRVLIADDHAIVLEGLSRVLSSGGDIIVAATAGSGPEALARLRDTPVDVIMLDLSLPGMSGIETLKQIKAECEDMPVLIFSMYPEEQYAVRCIKAGAAGYLNKSCEKSVLLEAIRRASAGRQYITPAVGECLLQEVQHPGQADEPHLALSDREFEVLRMIAAGSTPADIAQTLKLSPKTISTYRTRILEKLNLSTNAEMMRYAFEHGIADRTV